ncbi:MAG: hypothetical protein HKP58_19765 [Desulfatitalea sp.]|nr:hypothetical protein [Desulfatitalea sp.]NNK02655.1 hypothetical protein [Desulfatitalea sp.]
MVRRDLNTLLQDECALRRHVQQRLDGEGTGMFLNDVTPEKLKDGSVVLFVLGNCRIESRKGPPEPCLMLTKRSAYVRQAGDLCCPGGGLSWRTDRLLAWFLLLPGSPLRRWIGRRGLPALNDAQRRRLALLLAVGMRETWEEVRMNPFGFTFLGMLPEQHLVMFNRVIYPMVGWVAAQPFHPNREVDRIVPIPLRRLFDPNGYGRFRPVMATTASGDPAHWHRADFPCFTHSDAVGQETLWGATYRITTDFLQRVFDFSPPSTARRRLVSERLLDETYLNGAPVDSPQVSAVVKKRS